MKFILAFLGMILLGLGYLLLAFGPMAFLLYVAYHFLLKYW